MSNAQKSSPALSEDDEFKIRVGFQHAMSKIGYKRKKEQAQGWHERSNVSSETDSQAQQHGHQDFQPMPLEIDFMRLSETIAVTVAENETPVASAASAAHVPSPRHGVQSEDQVNRQSAVTDTRHREDAVQVRMDDSNSDDCDTETRRMDVMKMDGGIELQESQPPDIMAETQEYDSEMETEGLDADDRDISVSYTLHCARNEVCGVQIHVSSSKAFILTTDKTNWLHPFGHAPRARVALNFINHPTGISPKDIEVMTVGFVEDENNNMVMEYLEQTNFSTKASRAHAVYVRIRVPSNIPTGLCELEACIFTQAAGFCDESLSWRGAIQLQVENVVIPPTRDWNFHLDLWQHLTSLARAHQTALWSDDHFAVIERYYASLSQLGQKSVTIVCTEVPWAGQQCFLDKAYPSSLYEHAAIRVSRNGDPGSPLKIDFSVVERILDLAAKYHMDNEIELFGIMSVWADESYGFGGTVAGAVDHWRIRYYSESDGTLRYLRTVPEVREFLSGCHNFFKEKGLIDKVRICADEPNNMKVFYHQVEFLRAAAPEFRLKVAINHFEFMKYAPREVVDCVLLLPLVCENSAVTKDLKDHLVVNKGKMLWYVCCIPPYPNNFVSSPLVEGQLIGWLTFFLKLDGFLRWNFCLWPTDPWADLRWRADSWPVGDMYFVLPGKNGFPVETLRYEALRVGIQDYELLCLARSLLEEVDRELLFEKVKRLIFRTSNLSDFSRVMKSQIPRWQLYSLDPKDYLAARSLVLEAIANTGQGESMI